LIPPSEEINLIDRIRIEEKILPIFTGGTVFRTFFGETIDPNTARRYIQKLTSTKIPYFDLTAIFSVCSKEGKYFPGKLSKCPDCQAPVEVFSRVVGYYRPKSKYNPGKEKEFEDRRMLTSKELRL